MTAPALLRPEPLPPTGVTTIPPHARPDEVATRLLDGRRLVETRSWSEANRALDALARHLPPPAETLPRPDKRAARRRWEQISGRLLARVQGGRILLDGAPHVALLGDLYPPGAAFLLPVPTLRALAGASRTYAEGVHLPVLGHRLHPLWGTYVPTRQDHLELFATFLAGWDGPRERAIDVGTGSGVLAFLLARAGFADVLATDANPSACESVRRDVARRPEPPPVRVWHGDLLPREGPAADLIVFNPPWLVGAVDSPLDAALHGEADLVARFVERALPRLSTKGRLAIVFSNLIELVQPEHAHPVKAVVAAGAAREVQVLRRKVKGTRLPDGRRRRTKERVEVWELAAPEG